MSESVPSVWTRGDTIAVRVTIINMGTSSAYLTVTFEGWDYYYNGWYKEFSASKYVVVRRQSYKTIWLYPQVPYTSVGLKKAIVKATGSAYIVHDLGYNFVQKYNENELNLDDIEPLGYGIPEDYYYELSDLYHYTDWSIRKEAANAADYTNTPYETGEALFWHVYLTMHYVDNSLTGDSKTLSDTRIIDEGYIGVCDEYATLFISFAKALGLLARGIHFSISNGDDHAIAEFWDGNRWVHVDATVSAGFDYPRYYADWTDWNIYHVYIKYGADDSLSDLDGLDDNDGILYLNPQYKDGQKNNVYPGDIEHYVTYENNPYQ